MNRKPLALTALVLAGLATGVALATAPAGKFVATDETVTDTQTGLVWQRQVGANGLTFSAADAICANLSLAGKDDWRVPSMKELHTLIDYSVGPGKAAIDEAVFPSTPSAQFWTATLVPSFLGQTQHYVVMFGGVYGPIVGLAPPSTPGPYVRCVR
jgi:hypothetical protein